LRPDGNDQGFGMKLAKGAAPALFLVLPALREINQ
jgi:hypothetical protein